METVDNVVNIYKFFSPNYDSAFLYSIRSTNPLFPYSYFLLSSWNSISEIKRIPNAIEFLQDKEGNLKEISNEDTEYDEFTSLFAKAVKSQKEFIPPKRTRKNCYYKHKKR